MCAAVSGALPATAMAAIRRLLLALAVLGQPSSWPALSCGGRLPHQARKLSLGAGQVCARNGRRAAPRARLIHRDQTLFDWIRSGLIVINAQDAVWLYKRLAVRGKGCTMDVAQAISGRRSVREYAGGPVDSRLIGDLIMAAVQAPNAVNEQPWTFAVASNQEKLDRISDGAKAHMLANMGADPHADRFRGLLSDPSFQIFYHAPTLVLISGKASGPWIVEDCALAAENLMLAAYAAGLGSCWIGFARGYLSTPEGKAMLGLPSEWIPVAPIVLGYPKVAAAPVPRHPPEIRWIA